MHRYQNLQRKDPRAVCLASTSGNAENWRKFCPETLVLNIGCIVESLEGSKQNPHAPPRKLLAYWSEIKPRPQFSLFVFSSPGDPTGQPCWKLLGFQNGQMIGIISVLPNSLTKNADSQASALKDADATGLEEVLGIGIVSRSSGIADLVNSQGRMISQEDKSTSCFKTERWDQGNSSIPEIVGKWYPCAWGCGCTYVCIYVCVHMCVYMRMCIHMCMCVYMCLCVSTWVCIHVYISVCACVYTCVYTCMLCACYLCVCMWWRWGQGKLSAPVLLPRFTLNQQTSCWVPRHYSVEAIPQSGLGQLTEFLFSCFFFPAFPTGNITTDVCKAPPGPLLAPPPFPRRWTRATVSGSVSGFFLCN